MNLVSLCMIVKDEEDELPLALRSAEGLVDEIVVYDTGSSDSTVAVARELGARVVEGYWDDDFSRARNAALGECSGAWILWLDADETVHGDFAGLRARLERGADGADGFVIPLESLEGSGLGGHVTFHAARVFRREACWWAQPLHEQVVLRETGEIPVLSTIPDIRILHRGYVAAAADERSKVDRNVRLARQALEAAGDGPDRPYAVFNLGRSLAMEGSYEEAGEALREAVETSPNPTVRRGALQNLVRLELVRKSFDDAAAALVELRAASTRQVSADILEAQLHFLRGDHQDCLEVLERVPFVDLDDDGFEQGAHSVAHLRYKALYALGRPGEAADALLDAMRSHGVLDEPLRSLAVALIEAGRPVGEIAGSVRPECLAIVSAAATTLELPLADVVLAGLAERFPERLEPLAAAAPLSARLPVARALFWSARLRARDLAATCPLVLIAADASLEPQVRLRAAAAAHGAFGDERAVDVARRAFLSLAAGDRVDALDEVAQLSPALAPLLGAGASRAVHLFRAGVPLPGYVNCVTRPDAGDVRVDPVALPFARESVHRLVARDVLAAVAPEQVPRVLGEWLRVCAPGSTVEVRVPNLEAAARDLLAGGDLDAIRRALYGGRRFGDLGAGESNATGWTPSALRAQLEAAGFALEQLEAGPELVATARRVALDVRRSAGPTPDVSVIVLVEAGAGRLLAGLRSMSSVEAGRTFELVVVDNASGEETAALLDQLGGDVTTCRSPLRLERSRALAIGADLARSPVLVLLDEGAECSPGWLKALTAGLEPTGTAAVGAKVLDRSGLVLHAGYDLFGDPDHGGEPVLVATPRAERLGAANPRATAPAAVDALGPGCVALRRSTWLEIGGVGGGYGPLESMLDLSLRIVARGGILQYEPGCEVVLPDGLPAEDLAGRRRLAYRWSGRAALAPLPERRVTRASLLPSTTLVERIESGGAGIPVPGSPRAGGCNLVGDFDGLVATSARVLGYVAALRTAGAGLAPVAYAAGKARGVGAPGDDAPFSFATSLLCMEGSELVAYVAAVGLESLRDRYTVGLWSWPLGSPARDTVVEASMVHEIWVPSDFTRRAIAGATDRAVLRLPPAVLAPPAASRAPGALVGGADWRVTSIAEVGGAQPGELACANATGAVRAYCEAFPAGAGTGLVVRLTGTGGERAAEACREAAAGRADVVAIAGALAPGEEDALLADADCYLSLHRSTAFALPLARAMAAGKPVVATGYGGCCEYLDEDHAAIVPFSLVTTTEEDRPFPAGVRWAEPDLDEAARALRRFAGDAGLGRETGARARAEIERLYAPAVAAKAIRRRLAELEVARRAR
ncbi:MAG TPA: glycosyltransferase [Acidimicrobiales bacterium]|nr:glycosyltransferase [Acidimicrobiales bacterium]